MLPINCDLSCSMLARFPLRRRRYFLPPPPHFTRLNASHVLSRRRPSRNIHKNAKPMRRKCVFQPSLNINFNSSLSSSLFLPLQSIKYIVNLWLKQPRTEERGTNTSWSCLASKHYSTTKTSSYTQQICEKSSDRSWSIIGDDVREWRGIRKAYAIHTMCE